MILLFTFLFSIIHNEKIIEDTYEFEAFRPVPLLQFIDENEILSTRYNTFLPYTIIDDDFSNPIDSKKSDRVSISLIKKYNVSRYSTNIKFHDVTLSNFPVYIYHKHIHYYTDKGIGLGYKFQDEEMSFVHQLYKNRCIDHLMYVFKGDMTLTKGITYFGGVPQNEHLKLPYQGHCDVIDGYSSWGCNLTSIQLGNDTLTVNKYSAFHTGFYRIHLPPMIYEFVKKHLEVPVSVNECIEELNEMKGNNILCKSRKYLDMEFNFMFEGVTLKMTLNSFFEINKDDNKYKYKSVMYKNPYPAINNIELFLGFHFTNLFNYTVFDYENKQVEFYSYVFPIVNDIGQSSYKETQLLLFTVISVICSLSIIVIVYNYYRKG